jgi:tetratricopeptide (TPR) repeat protein
LAETQIQQGKTEDALNNLYSALARSFDNVEKDQIASRILDLAPDDVATRLQYAGILAKEFKWSSAIREYSKVLDAQPEQIDAYLGIAEAYTARQDEDTAVEYLQRGLDHASQDSQKEDLYLALISTLQTQAGAGRALPDEGQDARISLAKLYISGGQNDQALQQLQAVQSDEPAYRLDEVNALIVQAGGTVNLPSDESGTDSTRDDTNSSAGSDDTSTPQTSPSDSTDAAQ